MRKLFSFATILYGFGAIIIFWFLFCVLKIELAQSISIVVLAGTGLAIFIQALATKKMAEYQIMPAVDVNMVYDSHVKKTYFWFSNASNIPAFVLIRLKTGEQNREQKIGPLRISPNNPAYQCKKTATAFDFICPDNKEATVIINITVTPAFDNNRIEFSFTKSYRFNQSKDRWDETSWGYPDPSFPEKKLTSQ